MIRLIAFVLFLSIVSFSVRAEWKPAAGPLMTKWAADVKPDNPLPDYPRPQLQRDKWLSLNGLWQYQLVKDAKEAETPPIGKELPDQILVPFPLESALSGVMKRSERIAYRRMFDVPKEWAGQHVRLNFGAVNWESSVYVNGKLVGTHKGGYDPFSYDITSALKDGGNEVIAAVYNPANQGEQPRGKQVNNPGGIFYLPSTGIWQTVWIEPVSPTFINAIVLTPDVDKQELNVTVEMTGDAVGTKIEAVAELNLPDQKSKSSAVADGSNFTPFKISVANPRLWWPQSPDLYDLTITIKRDGKTIDEIKSYFAMRKIALGKDNGVTKMMLNGKFVFEIGPLDQGYWPDGLYTAPTDAALKSDIEIAKELGFNMIRKHVKVEPQRWYYWTDKLGMLVWQDMPSGEHVAGKKGDRSAEGKLQHEAELERMIANLRSHPSIVVWVVFNEGWGQYDTERIVRWTKEFDPSRLVDNASGWTDKKCGDLIDMHNYPGPGAPKWEETRAAVLGEFGGVGLAVEGHQWVKSAKNWGYNGLQKDADGLTKRYEQLLRKTYALVNDAGLSAAVYTQITDVETESNGLLTYDRIMKGDAKRIAAANKGELGAYKIIEVVPASQKTAQTWRYTLEKPADDWIKPDFDDSKWKEGPAGFGTDITPGAKVRTVWNTNDIWIRRTAEITEENLDGAMLLCHHDDDVEIYLNGILAYKAKGYVAEYTEFEMTAEGKKALQKGKNTIAAHCHQYAGGQYIDVGIIIGK